MFETYNLRAVAGNLHDKLPNESQSFNEEALNKSSSIPQKLEQHPFACNIFQDANKKAALNINVNVSIEKKHLERIEPLITLNASKFAGPVSPTFAYSKNVT